MPVLALGEWFGKTPPVLGAEKLGLIPAEDLSDNPHVRRGNVLEPIAAQEFTRETGLKLRRVNRTLFHPEFKFLTTHLDRIVTGVGTPVEIKCPSSWKYRQMKRHGIDQGYQVQGQQEAMIYRKAGVIFFIFCADLWEGFQVEVKADKTIQDNLIDLGREFWSFIEAGEIPPAPAPAPIDLPAPEGVTADKIITRNDPEWIGAVARLKEAQQIKDEANALEIERIAEIKTMMGGPGHWIKTPAGDRMDWSHVKGRRTFDRKALATAHPEIDLEPFFKTGQPTERFQARWAKED